MRLSSRLWCAFFLIFTIPLFAAFWHGSVGSSPPATGCQTSTAGQGGGTVYLLNNDLFSPCPAIATGSYYTPGISSQAVSTADWYNIDGVVWFRPYDLNTMGTPGANVKAATVNVPPCPPTGCRYIWVPSADHLQPVNLYAWEGGVYVGFSNDPGIPPQTLRMILNGGATYTVPGANNAGTRNLANSSSWLNYNPDDGTNPFYIFVQTHCIPNCGFGIDETLFATPDFSAAATPIKISHAVTAGAGGDTAFQQVTRVSSGNWISFGGGSITLDDGSFAKWTSSDVTNPAFTIGAQLTQCFNTIDYHVADSAVVNVTIGGVVYRVNREDTRTGNGCSGVAATGMYLNRIPINATTGSIDTSVPGNITRLSNSFDGAYPGPTYLQDVSNYLEDGVNHMWAPHGFFSAVGCQAGQPYTGNCATGGGLQQQFIQYYAEIADASAAASAAPFGVSATCAASACTIVWYDKLPNHTYQVQVCGTDATCAAPSNHNVTNTGTYTDGSPSANVVNYYNVCTLLSGVVQACRLVHQYASARSLFVNQHATRVSDDGGDLTTINFAWLSSVETCLKATGGTSCGGAVGCNCFNQVEIWASSEFGVHHTGSNLIRAYDIGTTRLPRGGDLTACPAGGQPCTPSANLTYSASGLGSNSVGRIINGNTTAWSYFGAGPLYGGTGAIPTKAYSNKLNMIRRKTGITFLASYVSALNGFVALSEGYSVCRNTITLSQSTTNAQFIIEQCGASNTATRVLGALSTKIIGGTYDGTSITAWSEGVAGTPVTATISHPSAPLQGQFGNSGGGGSDPGALLVGSTTGVGPGNFDDSLATGSIGNIIYLDGVLTSAQMVSLTSLIRSHEGN